MSVMTEVTYNISSYWLLGLFSSTYEG